MKAGFDLLKNKMFIISIIILIFLLYLVCQFINKNLEPFKIISQSMAPTLQTNDYVLKTTTLPKDLRNRIVVFYDKDHYQCIKRVIGCPNDEIELINGYYYINGRKENCGLKVDVFLYKYWKLGKDQYFVVGDNRCNSLDSTDFGPILKKNIEGVIKFRYFPLHFIDNSMFD